jgi:hypothetical protein
VALTHATITNVSKQLSVPIRVGFNPTEYTVSRGANYAEVAAPGLSTPILQFVRGEAESLRMELLLDGTDGRTDVHDKLEALRALVRIDSDLHTPPVVQFSWGKESFQGVVTQLEEKMTLFDQEGGVLRSRVTLTFKSYESVETQQRQTPMFSPDRTRVRVLREGQTLAHVAYEAYGDPSLWRAIAETNGIERPRFVPAGTALVVPAI